MTAAIPIYTEDGGREQRVYLTSEVTELFEKRIPRIRKRVRREALAALAIGRAVFALGGRVDHNHPAYLAGYQHGAERVLSRL